MHGERVRDGLAERERVRAELYHGSLREALYQALAPLQERLRVRGRALAAEVAHDSTQSVHGHMKGMQA
jgi:hypothetical protein